MTRFANMVRAFARDEEGVALTEYVVLLGILIAGVLIGVGLFGAGLNTAFYDWSTWFNNVPTPA